MDYQTTKFIRGIKASIAPGSMKCSSGLEGCLFISVRPKSLTEACHACMAAGAVFDSAFVSPAGKRGDGFDVYYLFRLAPIHRMVIVRSRGKTFGALSATYNAALWDERKMADLTGMRMVGMPDSRPLLFHPESGMPPSHPVGRMPLRKPDNNDYPMIGTGAHGEFEVAVGPVHAGIIEPGHFRFHVVGEKINKMEVRMFYLHRGIENAAEGKAAVGLLPMIEQISGDESVANGVAYCAAVERCLGLSVPKRAENIRAILMELERIYSHLADMGGMAIDVGFYLASSRFAVMREDMMRLNQTVSGNRFLRGECVVGGVEHDFDEHKILSVTRALEHLLESLEQAESMALTSSTFLNRIFQTGIVAEQTARNMALVGPAARASGVHSDLRLELPYSVYPTSSLTEPVEKGGGDVLARFSVKLAELKESVRLIRLFLSNMPSGSLRDGGYANRKPRADGIGIGWSEAPRGGCTFLVIISKNGTVRRMACRTASFRNWRALERAVEGNIVPDFPLINKSFNLSYAGADL